jgi:predicted Zn-dependent peptidase
MNSSSIERTTLPNGVRLLLIPLPSVGSIATSVMVGVGSRYEKKEWNGISHFLEHMVFKGTQKYPTTDDVNVIERNGGLQNAYTDIDITNFHNKVLSSDWKIGLDINKELSLHPLLEQQHVDKERDVIIEEMKRYDDEPASKVDEAFHTMMYKHQQIGMRIIGEEGTLRNVNAPELTSYHKQWYQPDRMVVVLSGDIDSHTEEIKRQVEEWFAGIPSSSIDPTQSLFDTANDTQSEPQVEVVTKPDANQAHFELGIRTFARTSEDRYAWGIFNLLMGVSFSSRLFREIREKKGLCYHIRSTSSNWSDTGYWSIYAGVATDKVEEAVTGVVDELKKVVQEGVSDDEVAISKKRLRTMLTFRAEDPEFQNEYYGRQELLDGTIISLDEFHNRLEAVTKDQINELVKKYIVQHTLNLALVWNKPHDENLKKLLVLSS